MDSLLGAHYNEKVGDGQLTEYFGLYDAVSRCYFMISVFCVYG